MDIVGLGTDIVECTRVAALIDAHAERFLNRVYTSTEALWCNSRVNTTECFASLWAGKEAVFRSLSLSRRGSGLWPMVEVDLKTGTPRVTLLGPVRDHATKLGVGTILLTTAATRHYATATAIALRGES
jgi:holo-[acyl-carrier protein] synthase